MERQIGRISNILSISRLGTWHAIKGNIITIPGDTKYIYNPFVGNSIMLYFVYYILLSPYI